MIGLEVILMVIVVILGIALRDVWGYLFTSDPEVQCLASSVQGLCLYVVLPWCHIATSQACFCLMQSLVWVTVGGLAGFG